MKLIRSSRLRVTASDGRPDKLSRLDSLVKLTSVGTQSETLGELMLGKLCVRTGLLVLTLGEKVVDRKFATEDVIMDESSEAELERWLTGAAELLVSGRRIILVSRDVLSNVLRVCDEVEVTDRLIPGFEDNCCSFCCCCC